VVKLGSALRRLSTARQSYLSRQYAMSRLRSATPTPADQPPASDIWLQSYASTLAWIVASRSSGMLIVKGEIMTFSARARMPVEGEGIYQCSIYVGQVCPALTAILMEIFPDDFLSSSTYVVSP